MAATIEVKFFNSFLLKKTVSNSNIPIWNGSTGVPTGTAGSFPVVADTFTQQDYSYYVEEARIRGGYNNTNVSYGVRAYLVEEEPNSSIRFNSLIYSGIFNSRTGVNDTNVFSVGQDITKSVDPANGSIQKLYAEDTNLIVFQENKVSRALIDKDAIYSAEGGGSVTSSNLVIGQIVPYAGNFGISKNPESFAVYGYRKYFTDRARGCVLRLSADGITEISSYGMHDFFRDELAESVQQIRAGWDAHNKNYVLSIQKTDNSYKTLTFDESVLGWTSFFDYKPDFITSLKNNFYSLKITTNNGQGVWLHNTGSYGKFYEIAYDSNVTVILNKEPSLVKNFKTINYEGSDGWQLESMTASSGDVSVPIGKYALQTTLSSLESDLFVNNFKRKENKFFANLINNSPAAGGEVLWGPSSTGLKGFFTEAKIKLINSDYPTTKKELFAVSSDIVESSY